MWLTPDQNIIQSGDAYTGTDGTRYPANFPKDQIVELTQVTMVEKPTITRHQSASYTVVDGTQVWAVTDWTTEQIEQDRLMSVPQSVAMWQAREVLIDAGLLAPINAMFASIPDPVTREKAQAKFEYSGTVKRDDPLILMAASALGLTDLQIDNLFIAAYAL
ncbi:hypothetical protein [Herminiimonas sp. CN]|uniref:hypothetical protein n=1 Tax=Herminiimonas sp. CN TaxID=1349818 RepID=UPI0004731B4B|nr:hypothetical protein [Herminiimonas sp. CN]